MSRILRAAAAVALVVVVPVAAAVPAQAFEGPPPRVAVLPQTVFGGGSLDSASATERARMVGNTVPQGVASGRVQVSTPRPSLSKLGTPFVTVVGGLAGGWAIGSGAASMVGLDSNAALAELTGTAPSVLQLQRVPDYVPNGDSPGMSPGWTNGQGPFFQDACWRPRDQGECSFPASGTVEVIGDPTFGTSSPLDLQVIINSEVTLGGTGLRAAPRCLDQTGSVIGGFAPFLPAPEGSSVIVYDLTEGCPAPLVFDSVEIDWSQGSPENPAYPGDPSPPATEWYPPGHQLRPPEMAGDPARVWEVQAQCRYRDGTVRQVTARSETFTETSGTYPAVPDVACTPGEADPSDVGEVTSVRLLQTTPDGSGPVHELDTFTTPTGLLDWQREYPECRTGQCLLRLYSLVPTRTECHDNPSACLDWFTDPNKAQNFECRYGPAVVALSQCNVYRPSFNPGTSTRTPYADPLTGDVPAPLPNPGGAPGTTPGARDCWPSGWGAFNPAEWVLRPLYCAFVPRPGSVTAQVGQVRDQFMSRPPGSVLVGAGAALGGVSSGWSGGCSSLPDFDPAGLGRLALPCSPPASGALTALRAVATVGVVTTTAFYLWHMVGAHFGGKVNGNGD